MTKGILLRISLISVAIVLIVYGVSWYTSMEQQFRRFSQKLFEDSREELNPYYHSYFEFLNKQGLADHVFDDFYSSWWALDRKYGHGTYAYTHWFCKSFGKGERRHCLVFVVSMTFRKNTKELPSLLEGRESGWSAQSDNGRYEFKQVIYQDGKPNQTRPLDIGPDEERTLQPNLISETLRHRAVNIE